MPPWLQKKKKLRSDGVGYRVRGDRQNGLSRLRRIAARRREGARIGRAQRDHANFGVGGGWIWRAIPCGRNIGFRTVGLFARLQGLDGEWASFVPSPVFVRKCPVLIAPQRRGGRRDRSARWKVKGKPRSNGMGGKKHSARCTRSVWFHSGSKNEDFVLNLFINTVFMPVTQAEKFDHVVVGRAVLERTKPLPANYSRTHFRGCCGVYV